MKIILQIVLWFFPWFVRRFYYVHVCHYELGEGARIGKSIVLAKALKLGAGARIGSLNFIKQIDRLELGEKSTLGNLNWITGMPTSEKFYFAHVIGRKCQLVLGRHSAITSRHFIDCTGDVVLGNYVTFGGIKSQILTHFIDIYECRQTCKSIEIGDYCFIGTRVLMLPGSRLPAYSVLGGGSVLTKPQAEEYAVYAGNPAIVKKSLKNERVRYFQREVGRV